jgi:hypothetical protein
MCCSEATFEFLALDHIAGGGNAHRREIGTGPGDGASFARWVVKNNYPDSIQLLCHNCNSAKAFYGQCPHQRGK